MTDVDDSDGSDGWFLFGWSELFFRLSFGAAFGGIFFVGGSVMLVPSIA